MMAVDYFVPAPPLRSVIAAYYSVRTKARRMRDTFRASVGQFRFVLAGSFRQRRLDGARAPLPPAHLAGPSMRAMSFDLHGPCHIFGAALLPAGWRALVGMPAAELTDRVVDLAGLFGSDVSDLHERLLGAVDDAGRACLLDTALLGYLDRAAPVPWDFTKVVDGWLVGSPAPHVDELLRLADVSPRQAARLSKEIYGATPKMLSRKYRTLQAAVRLGRGEAASWSEAAGDYFYDQSHFIREFKHFTGSTPRRFARDEHSANRVTIARQRDLPLLPRLIRLS